MAYYRTVVREATEQFFDEFNFDEKPNPSEIGDQLLDFINERITAENLAKDAAHEQFVKDQRAKGVSEEVLRRLTQKNRARDIKRIEDLNAEHVAEFLIRFENACNIIPSNNNAEEAHALTGVYCDSGPKEGIYLTGITALRNVVRKYYFDANIKFIDEVIAILQDRAPRVCECNNRDLIAVNNGIFDYKNKQLLPFDPQYVFKAKSQVDYVPNPKNPVITNKEDGTVWDIESWMDELSDDPEVVNLLWEVIGAVIRPHVRWNKSAWFYSEKGNNGKGTLVALMRNICGKGSYTSIPLSDFSRNFQLEPLTRSSAILVDENDVDVYIDRVANLKAVITNDVIMIDRKYQTPITFQFWGFMVQCINSRPRIKDKSESFYRRQLFIPFTKCFTGAERRYIKDDYINRQEVLQYVLHRVLHMDYYEFTETDATREAMEEYKRHNDPLRAFWMEMKNQFTWDLLPFSFLYDLYVEYSRKNAPQNHVLGRNTFTSQLISIIESDPDPIWSIPANTNTAHRTLNRMNCPEPLVLEYNLIEWQNKSTTNRSRLDRDRRATPTDLAQGYRGLLRAKPRLTSDSAADTTSAEVEISDEEYINNAFAQVVDFKDAKLITSAEQANAKLAELDNSNSSLIPMESDDSMQIVRPVAPAVPDQKSANTSANTDTSVNSDQQANEQTEQQAKQQE